MMRAAFPEKLQSPQLGRLTYSEFKGSGYISRRYEAEEPVAIKPGVKVRLLVWPPETGVSDAVEFTGHIEGICAELSQRLDEVLARAAPVVDEAITYFCIPDEDYTPPTAAQMLRAEALTAVKLGIGKNHEIELRDDQDLAGGHDLLIQLDASLTPVGANFDG